MKKRKFIILIILLGGFSLWLTLQKTSSGTSDKSKTEFAIEKVDLITKIYLYNKQQGHVTLEKLNGKWMVNGKYEASKPLMEFFLDETLKKIRVQGPVPIPARQNVIASMATMATKVEIYTKNKLEKVYYVGNPTSDMSGTYMYLEGSKDPYITHIPGFDGFLTSRYPVIENDWVSKVIIDYTADEIEHIKLEYPDFPDKSFTITRNPEKDEFSIVSGYKLITKNPNPSAVKSYVGLFQNKSCEAIIQASSQILDSLRKSKPYCILSLSAKNGTGKTIKLYQRKIGDRDHGVYDNKGNALVYDASRFNALIENDDRLYLIQDVVFGSVLISFSDFYIASKVD